MRGIRRYRAEGESGEILAEGRKESVNPVSLWFLGIPSGFRY